MLLGLKVFKKKQLVFLENIWFLATQNLSCLICVVIDGARNKFKFYLFFQYKSDLKRKRRQHPLKGLHKGTNNKGEVTEQLATVLKSLWSLQYDPEVSIRFKSLVEKHASQYKGNNQVCSLKNN